MSNRLNKATREAILRDVMRYRWTVPVTEFYKRRADAAAMIFDYVLDLSTRSHLDRLPVGFVPEASHFSVTIGGVLNSIALSGGTRHGYVSWFPHVASPERKTRRVKYSQYQQYDQGGTTVLGVLDARHSLAILWEKLQGEKEDLIVEYRKSEKLLATNLKGATTFKKLIEQWPEIETFAKPYYSKEQNRALPVVQRDTLNELFYLPPPTVEETSSV